MEKLNPSSPEIICHQATINIGTIGHVAHGKSTVVRALSGVQTIRFKNEKERNITIKLGYANAKLYKCTNENCKPPECYSSCGSDAPYEIPCSAENCNGIARLVRHVSFIDCPGHDILMATMLNGAAVMDAALLLIAGNESCPQPQTSEHLAAVEIMNLKHLIVIQNKVELVKEERCIQHYEQIKSFIQGTIAAKSPIVPISAIMKYNIDVVIQYLCEQIPVPPRDYSADPEMIIIRSFDVNKPGEKISTLVGGVAGGSILKGVFKIGDKVEFRPGIITKNPDDSFKVKPIESIITSLYVDNNSLQFAVPGGLIGIGTNVDPSLTKGDGFVGQVMGHPGKMPDIYEAIEVNYYLLRHLIGARIKKSNLEDGSKKQNRVKPIEKSEYLMVNIGSTSVGARVSSVKSDVCKLFLAKPVCSRINYKVALSRRIDKNWRLIGWGEITRGRKVKI